MKPEEELRDLAEKLEQINLRVQQIMDRNEISLSIELNPQDLRSVAKRIEGL